MTNSREADTMRSIIPNDLTKYVYMSPRQRRVELKTTLWYMPLLYVLASLALALITLYIDNVLNVATYLPGILNYNPTVTRLLISALIGGILTLTAFTFNSLLMVLTTFSGQFSPRMLLNFVADSRTQHVLGVFTGSFIYVLTVFLFVTSDHDQMYVTIPLTTVFLALVTILVFIYFINHISTWMQVHNVTNHMKNISEKMIDESIYTELQPYRSEGKRVPELSCMKKDGQKLYAQSSGYIQIIDYINMINKATQDKAVISLHYRVGDYVLEGIPLMTYWSENQLNEKGYSQLIITGPKQTEIQDLSFGIQKLSEIALKAMGNDDPKTATHTIFTITDLLYTVSRISSFEPYLIDDQQNVRVILLQEDFNYYLNESFASIRYYAGNNVVLIEALLDALILLTQGLNACYHKALWEFGSETYQRMNSDHIYLGDYQKIKKKIQQLAELTNKVKEHQSI